MTAHTPANAVTRANAATALAGRKARILLLLGVDCVSAGLFSATVPAFLRFIASAAPAVLRSRCKEFEVGNDAAITDFDDGDELDQRHSAGDARVHPGPPMHRRLRAVNQYRENNLIPELERLDHHGQQRAELVDPDGAIGDRTDLAGAGDLEHGVI